MKNIFFLLLFTLFTVNLSAQKKISIECFDCEKLDKDDCDYCNSKSATTHYLSGMMVRFDSGPDIMLRKPFQDVWTKGRTVYIKDLIGEEVSIPVRKTVYNSVAALVKEVNKCGCEAPPVIVEGDDVTFNEETNTYIVESPDVPVYTQDTLPSPDGKGFIVNNYVNGVLVGDPYCVPYKGGGDVIITETKTSEQVSVDNVTMNQLTVFDGDGNPIKTFCEGADGFRVVGICATLNNHGQAVAVGQWNDRMIRGVLVNDKTVTFQSAREHYSEIFYNRTVNNTVANTDVAGVVNSYETGVHLIVNPSTCRWMRGDRIYEWRFNRCVAPNEQSEIQLYQSVNGGAYNFAGSKTAISKNATTAFHINDGQTVPNRLIIAPGGSLSLQYRLDYDVTTVGDGGGYTNNSSFVMTSHVVTDN